MKVIILGAGLSGLAAGYFLSKNGIEVLILEKENFLGGLASSFKMEWGGKEYWIPKTYHHILTNDKTTIKMIEKLGLKDKLKKKKVKTGFVYKNQVFGFTSPIEILKFPLPLTDKIKLAKFVLKISVKRDCEDLKNKNAKEWIIEEAGEKNFSIIFEQLIKNKFSQPAEEIPAAWFATRFAAEPSSFLKKFGWLSGGLQQFVDGMGNEIEKTGKILKNVEIEKISKNECRVVYKKDGKRVEEKADAIISTIPPSSFLKLIDKPSEEIKEKFSKIDYLGCICVALGLNYNPTKYYWLNILDKDFPFVAIFNYTQLFEDLAPKGKSILFLVKYLKKDDDFWRKDEEEIIDIFLKNLERVFPGCKERVEWQKVTKFENAEAIFNLGFENPPISDGKIFFAGIYRIFPKIRNMASAIESGIEAVEALLGEKLEV
jgi:protoporphyrinogen oxidase